MRIKKDDMLGLLMLFAETQAQLVRARREARDARKWGKTIDQERRLALEEARASHNKLALAEADLRDRAVQIKALGDSNMELIRSNDDLKSKLNQMGPETEQLIAALRNESETRRQAAEKNAQENNELRRDNNSLRNEVRKLGSQKLEMAGRLDVIRTRAEELRVEADTLRTDNQALNLKVQALENERDAVLYESAEALAAEEPQ